MLLKPGQGDSISLSIVSDLQKMNEINVGRRFAIVACDAIGIAATAFSDHLP